MNGEQVNDSALSKIKDALSRSKKLMEMSGDINKIAREKRGNIEEALNTEGVNLVSSPNKVNRNMEPINQNRPITKAASKLPREILESFKSNKIESDPLMANNSSVLDLALPKEELVVEERVPQPTERPQVSSGVDYSIIKMIVEESVRKYMSSLGKKIITESKNTSNGLNSMINIDGGFKFLTKNGDIYEAKLVKKGNIHDKKAKL